MSARAFLITTLATVAVMGCGIYALILVVDPYQNVPFSPSLDRAPISTNQRFSYPALARDAVFNSVIIGSSTLRLLNPDNLNRLTGARFANLAMNSATAFEQGQMHALFMRHHPDARYVLIGIDDSWCRKSATIKQFTFRQFPHWMYDENRWNDLIYLFNDKALENTVRMLELFAGRREPKYERNGFRDFTVDFGQWEEKKVTRRLYPKGAPAVRRAPDIAPETFEPDWPYAELQHLQPMLMGAANAQTLIVFAPMHGHYLARSEALYRECKGRVVDIAQAHGASVIDFMIDSDITSEDENYWDPLHFRLKIAHLIEADVAQVLAGDRRATLRYLVY